MAASSEIFNCVDHNTLPVQDRSGRTSCFNCIIVSIQTQAYNLARRMLEDWILAEDAVQESLVSGYRSFGQFRGDNLEAWLMRIVANTCRDMLRALRVRPTVPLDPLPNQADDEKRALSVADLPSTSESPEDHAVRGDLNRAIQNCLNGLPQEHRLAEVLVEYRG